MSPLRPDELIASYWTICGGGPGHASPWTIAERATAAASAGYRGIGLRNDDYVVAREAKVSDAELRQVLADSGIVVAEIEFVAGWSSPNEEIRASARMVEDELFALADALQTPCNINLGCSEPVDAAQPIEAMAESFAAFCRRASEHGLTAALEFMPWTGIPDAKTAWEVIRLAGEPNGGVLIDAWHYFRGAAEPAQLRAVPLDRIVGLQINDAAKDVVGSMRDDTLRRRRLPGDGDFDLDSFIRILDSMGVSLPYGVEIISDAQFALPLAKAAAVSFEATRSVLERAGHPVSSAKSA